MQISYVSKVMYIDILSEDVLDYYRMLFIKSDLRTAERNVILRMICGTNFHLKAVWDTSIYRNNQLIKHILMIFFFPNFVT